MGEFRQLSQIVASVVVHFECVKGSLADSNATKSARQNNIKRMTGFEGVHESVPVCSYR
jgi:hypothetical protein